MEGLTVSRGSALPVVAVPASESQRPPPLGVEVFAQMKDMERVAPLPPIAPTVDAGAPP